MGDPIDNLVANLAVKDEAEQILRRHIEAASRFRDALSSSADIRPSFAKAELGLRI